MTRVRNDSLGRSASHGRDAPGGTDPLQVDGALVARHLGLDVAQFRQLMADGRITVLCERGTGEDEGHTRATFYDGDRRVRLVLDQQGRLLSAAD